MPSIAVEDFQKVEMRVGKVVGVEEFPEARNPSYKLRIDFGSHGMKKSSAAIRPWYRKEVLLGRHVVAVTNFPPRQIGPVWIVWSLARDTVQLEPPSVDWAM